LEHTPPDETVFNNIIDDINRVLKPGGFSLHLFDVRFLHNGTFWTNNIVHAMFNNIETLNKLVDPQTIINDTDLYYMSERAYDKNWLPLTKIPYSQFGKASSLNILWRKPL
jgi:hypothetical protein